ncbi:MAG: response regulator [Nitrospirae bacterium]|nr:response regulator [Candidatus Troglogloeales bacterium]
MSVSIMVLEDNASIREGYSNILRNTGKKTFHTEVLIEAFATPDDAIRRLMDPAKQSFDLFLTDIDLIGSPKPNKAGLDFAKCAKELQPDVPIVGCSGYFGDTDLREDEKKLFDQWWPKGSNIAKTAEMFGKVVALALQHKKDHIATDQNKAEIETPVTDEDFEGNGYRMETILPSENNGYKKPFTLWVRETSQEGCELEVVGCSALMAWGDDLNQAREVLDELIEGYKSLLDASDDSLSPSMLKARDFIKKVKEWP